MKRSLIGATIALLLVALVALVGCSSGGGSSAPATSSSGGSSSSASPAGGGTAVVISNFAFSPAEVTVKVGDTVTWTNNDTVPHTITAAGFDSGTFQPGATYSHKFDTAGVVDYKCSIHPQMTGKVTVQ
jgi:plastocyanin